jgi:hypothetical protein
VTKTANHPRAALAILAGRSLAMCMHPYAAWRLRSSKGRALIVIAYGAAGYALVLAALMSF